MNSHPNIHPVTEKEMTPSEKWKLFFSTLLNIPVKQLNLELKVSDETILLTTPEHSLAERIKEILNSPERLRANLNYTLTERSMPHKSTPSQIPFQPPVLKHGSGINIYHQLFGWETLNHIGHIN